LATFQDHGPSLIFPYFSKLCFCQFSFPNAALAACALAAKQKGKPPGTNRRDLIPFIGSRNRVHEVLNGRRSLTLKMIWRLHEGLGIPAESLIEVGENGQPDDRLCQIDVEQYH
jgi:transcriptional regulator with XRE-family HTH domain